MYGVQHSERRMLNKKAKTAVFWKFGLKKIEKNKIDWNEVK